jgi:putative ABC transport system ATP-binding protein
LVNSALVTLLFMRMLIAKDREIMSLLAEIHRSGGTTILLVTHDVKVAAKTGRVLFILDGKIAGEYLAGAYDEAGDGLKAREERLSAWLAKMKF